MRNYLICDLSGTICSSWSVLKRVPSRNNNTYYLCRCVCNVEREVLAKNLISGRSTNCGCVPRKFNNLVGRVFEKWKVVSFARRKHNAIYYLCHCECGTKKEVRGTHLMYGASKSCGCLLTSLSEPLLANARAVYRKTYADGNLSFEDFLALSKEPCYYCGVQFSNTKNRYKTKEYAKFKYNGLDRLDSNLLHTKNNVVSCCKNCNRAKSDMSLEDFKNWIYKTYNYLFAEHIMAWKEFQKVISRHSKTMKKL